MRRQSTSSRSRISEISRVIRTIMSELTSNTIKLEQLEREVNRKLDRVPWRLPTHIAAGK